MYLYFNKLVERVDWWKKCSTRNKEYYLLPIRITNEIIISKNVHSFVYWGVYKNYIFIPFYFTLTEEEKEKLIKLVNEMPIIYNEKKNKVIDAFINEDKNYIIFSILQIAKKNHIETIKVTTTKYLHILFVKNNIVTMEISCCFDSIFFYYYNIDFYKLICDKFSYSWIVENEVNQEWIA